MNDLTGSLATIGLAPLLTFLRELGLSGQLTIVDDPLFGALYLEGGRIVGAVFDAETGAPAFESIVLLLTSGHFEFASDVDRQLNFMASLDDIQGRLESLSAERSQLARTVPSVNAVPRPLVSGVADSDEQVTLDLGTLRLWLQFDGRRSVASVGEDRGLLRTVRAVSRLVELGLLGLEQADESATAQPSRAGRAPWTALDHRSVSERAR
jgi:hypothetical protein